MSALAEKTKTAAQSDDLETMLKGRIARLETRSYDWDALKFQADFDPK